MDYPIIFHRSCRRIESSPVDAGLQMLSPVMARLQRDSYGLATPYERTLKVRMKSERKRRRSS